MSAANEMKKLNRVNVEKSQTIQYFCIRKKIHIVCKWQEYSQIFFHIAKWFLYTNTRFKIIITPMGRLKNFNIPWSIN